MCDEPICENACIYARGLNFYPIDIKFCTHRSSKLRTLLYQENAQKAFLQGKFRDF